MSVMWEDIRITRFKQSTDGVYVIDFITKDKKTAPLSVYYNVKEDKILGDEVQGNGNAELQKFLQTNLSIITVIFQMYLLGKSHGYIEGYSAAKHDCNPEGAIIF